VEKARRKKRLKHGGQLERVEFKEVEIPSPLPDDDLLAMDEALNRLNAVDPCYELFSDRTFHQIGVVRFWGMRPGWHRVFWPNNRAVVVWLWPGVSGRAAIVSGGFSSACHDGIVKCCELF
jgi:hypothetical protein